MENNTANVAVDATAPAAPTVSVVVPSPITCVKPFLDVSKIEVFGGNNFNRKHVVVDKGKEISTRSILVEDNNYQRKSSNRYDEKNGYKPKTNNQTFKEKNNCFVCGKSGHYVVQCRKRVGNDNPTKAKVNLTKAKVDDIIVAVVSQVNLVANMKDWVLASGATRHICANKKDFVSYTQVEEGEEVVYLADSRTTQVLGKGTVLLKLTSGKNLALNDVFHVPSIRTNLVSVGLLGKVGVKVSFESYMVVLTKNNNFIGKVFLSSRSNPCKTPLSKRYL
uniref:CCHC-type domain-containing protein n=1 Tax=Nicotiana tabacum TaxID=4097 RepID=A0A1S3Y0T3_TOBAC|nr:PREDICTED: uncharacterized protein LOC107770860 [Nicotiana tabacum]